MSLIVMGINDHRHCLGGWHALQTDGRNGIRFRWTSAEARLRLRVPEGAAWLRLFLSGPAALTGRPAPLSVYVGSTRLAHLPEAAPTEFWTVADVDLRESGSTRPRGPWTEFVLRSEERLADGSFRPRTVTFDQYLRNGDHRPLGVMVGGIRVF